MKRRIRSDLTDKELDDLYTPTPGELAFVRRSTKSPVTKLGLSVLLKTFQRLGYFSTFDKLPPRLVDHIAKATGAKNAANTCRQYEAGSYRWRHMPLVRNYLSIKPFSEGGRRVLVSAVIDAAQSKDILADIVNVGIEALVQACYELPAFSTLQRAALRARAQTNQSYFRQTYGALDDPSRHN